MFTWDCLVAQICTSPEWSVKNVGRDLKLLALGIGSRRPLLLADPCLGSLGHIRLAPGWSRALWFVSDV